MALSRTRAKLIARLGERRGREREGLFLVEGIRSAREALAASARVSFALVAPRLGALAGGSELRPLLADAGVETVELSDAELEELSDTETPQGVLLVCAEPEPLPRLRPNVPVLALDGIQDPGNVGTLIRAAVAFGVPDVLVLDGTVDPYNAKAVRASAGAIFRASLRRARWSDVVAEVSARGPLLVADMAGGDPAGARPGSGWTLVVGGEGAGPRPEARAAATALVGIPMAGGVESLNAGVAGSILLYVLNGQARRG